MSLRREHISLLAPASGRRDTVVAALEELHDLTGGTGAHIVEVGTTRNATELACLTDGWATRVFAWYSAETGGCVRSLDPNVRAIAAAEHICGPWKTSLECMLRRAERWLRLLDVPIDLLYMDGPSDAQIHLNIYSALRHPAKLVLWDDIVGHDPAAHWPKWPPEGVTDPYAVKGALAIPAMLQDGYEMVWMRGRQALLRLTSA